VASHRRVAPSLTRIYADPRAGRRAWWVHLPGPPLLLVAWIFGAPVISQIAVLPLIYIAGGIDHAYSPIGPGVAGELLDAIPSAQLGHQPSCPALIVVGPPIAGRKFLEYCGH
jgi:hypothetical protein